MGASVWDNVTALVEDEPYEGAATKKPTHPSEGGRTPKLCREWTDIEDTVKEWLDAKNIEQRLHGVPADALPMRWYGTEDRPYSVVDESMMYEAVMGCQLIGVNRALRKLGFKAAYMNAKGNGGNTLCDLRARTAGGKGPRRTFVPHEVKLTAQLKLEPTEHYATAVNGGRLDDVKFPLAQVFMYLVEEEARYAILSTKIHFTFLKRSHQDPISELFISRTFDASQEPVGPILLWMAIEAESEPRLLRTAYPDTSPEKKWIPPRKPRTQQASSAAAAPSRSDSDDSPDPDDSANADAAGAGPSSSAPRDKPATGLSSRTRSKRPFPQGGSSSSSSSRNGSGSSYSLQRLPAYDWESLQIGDAFHHSKHCVLRKGILEGGPTIFKVFDLSRQPIEALEMFVAEAEHYNCMQQIQGSYIPKLLRYGQSHHGLMAFLALSAGGPSLEEGCSQGEAAAAVEALGKVHGCGVLHGDIRAANFIRAPSSCASSVWVVDFGCSSFAPGPDPQAMSAELVTLAVELGSAS